MKLDTIYTQHFINNEFVDSKSKQTFDTVDPSTEEVIATLQRGDAQDIDVAVKAAREAFATWRDVSGPDRRDLLLKLADLVEENQQFLAEYESKDNGKPVSIARDVDIALAIKHLRYFAGWADKIQGKVIPTENTAMMAFTIHVSSNNSLVAVLPSTRRSWIATRISVYFICASQLEVYLLMFHF